MKALIQNQPVQQILMDVMYHQVVRALIISHVHLHLLNMRLIVMDVVAVDVMHQFINIIAHRLQ